MSALHIHPNFRQILSLPQKDRIHFLHEPRWIGYPKAQKIIDTMIDLMKRPVRPRMQNLLIIGDPNNGKTTIVQRFQHLQGDGYVDEGVEPHKPVIITEAPPTADIKGLYISLLERFFAPYRASDSVHKLHFQAIHLMRYCHVKILVIDEFHSLLAGTPVKQREVMNAIKSLCNELKIPIVGVGTREAVRVLHTDPQHASRFDVIPLNNWRCDKNFQRLLVDFEKILPLKNKSNLHSVSLAKRLHQISQGNFGDLHKLLVSCAIDAIESGEEKIDLEIIKKNEWIKPSKGIREVEL